MNTSATGSSLRTMLIPLALAAVGMPSPVSAASARPQNSFLTADLPGEVSRKSNVRDTIVGDITHHTHSSTAGDAKLSITATKLPGFVTAVATDGVLLRKARGELLKNYGARRTSWTTCSFRGYECRALKYTTSDDRSGMARFYLDGDVLVVVNATYGTDSENAESFLKSVS